MVEFDQVHGRFNYRVAGVAIHNGRVLLDCNSRNNYWVLPGGHPELMEPMTTAVRRELIEEIGADVRVDRLLWIVENFFEKKKPVHELSFYYLVHLPLNSPLLLSDGPFYGEEHSYKLTFQWFPLEEKVLSALPLYPSFLASALTNIPACPEHIVFEEYKRKPSIDKSDSNPINFEKEKKYTPFPSQ